MRDNIVAIDAASGQGTTSRAESLPLSIQSIIPTVSKEGFALVPGYTRWLKELGPLGNLEAWTAFEEKGVQEAIYGLSQQLRFFLGDNGSLEEKAQPSSLLKKEESGRKGFQNGARCD